MTWQLSTSKMTALDRADWQASRKASKLEQQRHRRKCHPRIDYYPSVEARAVIEAVARTRKGPDGTWSAVIDALVLGATGIK